MAQGFHAALLLARGRAEAVALVNGEDHVAQARRSFAAALLCLPALFCLRLIDSRTSATPLTAADLAMDVIGFVIGWAGFALLSLRVATGFGRAALWPRYITLWNWCNLVQYLMLFVAALPDLFGLPGWVGQTAALVAIGWALWLEWFMTRLALAVPPLFAAALVVMDIAIGLLVAGMTGT